MEEKKNILTREGLKRYEDELHELKVVRRKEVVKMILRHAQMLCDCKGERVGMREMRGHVHNYLTGFPGASKVRKKVNSITTLAELQALLAKEYPYA